jgi:hypothetical protein
MNFDPNLATVETALAALGELADDLLLIGGCAVGQIFWRLQSWPHPQR